MKEFIDKLNKLGIPIPLLRLNGEPTFTGTMTFISFNTALLGQIGKISGFLGGIDLTQANYLFLISLGAYLGRRIQGDGIKKTVTIENEPSEKKEGS